MHSHYALFKSDNLDSWLKRSFIFLCAGGHISVLCVRICACSCYLGHCIHITIIVGIGWKVFLGHCLLFYHTGSLSTMDSVLSVGLLLFAFLTGIFFQRILESGG